MDTCDVYTIDTAPDGSKPMLHEVARKLPFVPNLLGVLAGAPRALEAYLTLNKIFEKTSLDPVDRQLVLLAASRENGCSYCVAAHSALARMHGVGADLVNALREDRELPDPIKEALCRFVRQIVRRRGWIQEEDRRAFLEAGYTRAQLLEVLVGVTLKTLSNYTNHAADTPLDPAFSATAWHPPVSNPAPRA